MTIPDRAHAVVIPDSLLAKEATDILREHSTDLLVNHSMRVFLFAAEQGRQRKLRFDPELLYVAAAFHDLGLIRKFSSPDERFEVDGANAARQFLSAHNIAEGQVQTVLGSDRPAHHCRHPEVYAPRSGASFRCVANRVTPLQRPDYLHNKAPDWRGSKGAGTICRYCRLRGGPGPGRGGADGRVQRGEHVSRKC
jgi:hypothetical protein